MSADALVVVRAEFSMEDPWVIPPSCESVLLRRSTDGSTPRLETRVSSYCDDEYLTFVFACADDHIVATLLGHDEPIYNEDAVEVFLSPRVESEYFEIEVSPLGSTFDARIESPEGTRSSMKADVSWDCDGLIAAVRKVAMTTDILIRVPFAGLGISIPKEGEIWRGNLFRIDRHPRYGTEYTAWQPTMKNPADFHVTAAFGRLRFGA